MNERPSRDGQASETTASADRPTVEDLMRADAEHFLSACTQCGRCYEVCPMTDYMSSKDPTVDGAAANPREVVGGILEILAGRKGSTEALAWSAVCVKSSTCTPECPAGIDPMMMLRIARSSASGALGGERQFEPREDPQYFPRVRAFARLQLTEEEFKKWM